MSEKLKNQEIVERISRDPHYMENLLYESSTKTFYLYNGIFYIKQDDDDINSSIYAYLKGGYPELNITTNLVGDYVNQLEWQCYKKVKVIDTPYIALEDCLINL